MWNVLLGMILVLAGGAVIGAMAFQIYKGLQGSDEIEKCRLSLLANDQLGRLRQGGESHIAFDCNRQELRIELEDVDTRGRIDDEKVKSILAHEMKECWSMVGGGQLDPFTVLGSTNEIYCLVCTGIDFDEAVLAAARDQGYSLNGFYHYTVARKLHDAPGSLYEFIRGERPSSRMIELFGRVANAPVGSFNMDKRYVVVWRVEKYETGFDWPWNNWGTMPELGMAMATESARGFTILPSQMEGGVQSGAAVGMGTLTRLEGVTLQEAYLPPSFMYQHVFLMPEDALWRTVAYRGVQKEFCTWMVN